MKRILKSFSLAPNRKRKHSELEALGFSRRKHCGSALMKDWGRLCLSRACTLEKLPLQEVSDQTKCRWQRQVFSTQSWNWLAISELTASRLPSHRPHCSHLAALAPACFWFAAGCRFGACRKLQTHPSGSPYLFFCFCILCPCLLQALELLFVCLMPTWSCRNPALKSTKVKY